MSSVFIQDEIHHTDPFQLDSQHVLHICVFFREFSEIVQCPLKFFLAKKSIVPILCQDRKIVSCKITTTDTETSTLLTYIPLLRGTTCYTCNMQLSRFLFLDCSFLYLFKENANAYLQKYFSELT